MTFADLLTALDTRGVLTRAKDKKTSLRYLAAALGEPNLEACPVGDACRKEATWAKALETHFQAQEAQGRRLSASTRRNTRNDLRVLFRQAEEHGLLTEPMPARLLTKPRRDVFRRQQEATTPYKGTYNNQPSRRYWLPQAQWPAEIAQGWREYRAKCGMRLRETTFETYVKCLSTYLGYLTHIAGHPLTWDNVFDPALVVEFMHWHAARLGRTSTTHGQNVAIKMTMLAKVLGHEKAPALEAFKKTLKPPPPTHTKRFHWLSLAQLDAIGGSCLDEGRAPYILHPGTRSPGAQRAVGFQRGVILKLLVRVPLRQRNVREMQLGKNLWKDQATGHWHLHFAGDELKIGHRGHQVNTYELNLSTYRPEFIPVLEEWLTLYRPKLPNAQTSPFVFLTQYGNPHIAKTLHADLAHAVGIRTGQRFYPHLIRTIWATEYLKEKQDFQTAATMLGNTLAVVMRTYYDVVHQDQHAKASDFLATALKG